MAHHAEVAGNGEHRAYLIPGPRTDGGCLKAQEHYLSIDAVCWFVNGESGWFADRMATGTLTISLVAAEEEYEVALGLYDLRAGARMAPIFDKPVLPERVFRGGRITIKAVLMGLAKDNRLARLIRSSSAAALGVVGGMVQMASPTGPYAPLAAAGATLVGGLREILDVQDEKFRLFDPGGFQVTVRPESISGPETYLLLHRGTVLERDKLAIRDLEALAVPAYGDEPLTDGAWLLLRLRRVAEYPVERSWYSQYRRWISGVIGLVDDVQNGVLSSKDAMRAMSPGSESTPTAYDEYREVRSRILDDGVLTSAEATAYAGTLSNYRALAIRAIKEGDYVAFFDGIRRLRDDIRAGRTPEGESKSGFLREREHASSGRPIFVEEFSASALARRPGPDDSVFATFAGYTRLLNACPTEPVRIVPNDQAPDGD